MPNCGFKQVLKKGYGPAIATVKFI